MSTREANYESIYRILKMMRLLDRTPNRSMTVSSLATRLEISEKTVVRYAKALSETYDPRLGGPLLALQGRGQNRTVTLARDLLDHEERNVFRFASVRAATRLLARANGSILGDSSEGAVEVFRGTLSPQSRTFVERAETALCYVPFIPKDLRETEDVIDALLSAIIYRHVVEVDRHSLWEGKDKRERLEPYSLVVYRDGLYLLARRSGGKATALRTYALERIHRVEPDRSSSFEVPSDFDPDDYFEGRLGIWESSNDPERLELAFTAGAASVLSPRSWPVESAWRDGADGRCVLVLELSVTPELVSWIVSWGPQVEVLAPTSLRQKVAAEHRSALAQYGAEESVS